MDPTQKNGHVLNDRLLDELNSLKGILQAEDPVAQTQDATITAADGKPIPVLEDAVEANVPLGENLDLIAEINKHADCHSQNEDELEGVVDRILEQKISTLRQQLKQSILQELKQHLNNNYPAQ